MTTYSVAPGSHERRQTHNRQPREHRPHAAERLRRNFLHERDSEPLRGLSSCALCAASRRGRTAALRAAKRLSKEERARAVPDGTSRESREGRLLQKQPAQPQANQRGFGRNAERFAVGGAICASRRARLATAFARCASRTRSAFRAARAAHAGFARVLASSPSDSKSA